MAETRPTGEQIRFTSAKTGNHILDDYMEAVERGGRTLPDMVADIWSEDGSVRPDFVQYRINVATSRWQYRWGDFPNQTDGWIDLPDGFIFRARGAYVVGAAYERLDVVTFGTSTYLCTAPHTASASPPGPQFTKIISGAALDAAVASADQQRQWAENAAVLSHQDRVLAETAKTDAQTARTGAEAAKTAAETAKTDAQTAKTAAETARDQAVTAQTAAETARTAAQTAKTAAETARSQTENLFDQFDDRYLGPKAADPTTDNDGNALVAGALYFNSTSSVLKVWTGAAWQSASTSPHVHSFADISGDVVSVTGAIPKVVMKESDWLPNPYTYILQVNNGAFSIQRDANSDGTTESPVPLFLNPTSFITKAWGYDVWTAFNFPLDLNTAAPVSGDLLTYNGTKWVPAQTLTAIPSFPTAAPTDRSTKGATTEFVRGFIDLMFLNTGGDYVDGTAPFIGLNDTDGAVNQKRVMLQLNDSYLYLLQRTDDDASTVQELTRWNLVSGKMHLMSRPSWGSVSSPLTPYDSGNLPFPAQLNGTNTFTAKNVFGSSATAAIKDLSAIPTVGAEIRSSVDTGGISNGPAILPFHRPSAHAAFFGLDTDNQWKVGGFSMGAVSYKIWHEGNFNPTTKANTDNPSVNGSVVILGGGGPSSLNFIPQGTSFDANGRGWHVTARPTNYATTSEQGDLIFTRWTGSAYVSTLVLDGATNTVVVPGDLQLSGTLKIGSKSGQLADNAYDRTYIRAPVGPGGADGIFAVLKADGTRWNAEVTNNGIGIPTNSNYYKNGQFIRPVPFQQYGLNEGAGLPASPNPAAYLNYVDFTTGPEGIAWIVAHNSVSTNMPGGYSGTYFYMYLTLLNQTAGGTLVGDSPTTIIFSNVHGQYSNMTRAMIWSGLTPNTTYRVWQRVYVNQGSGGGEFRGGCITGITW